MKAILVVLALLAVQPAFALGPDEILPDPRLEARARQIGKELRCLVCQNQSIDDSDADLARDLRLLVRERLTKGDSDEAVKQFVVARYGDYVLLRPPFKSTTWLLWLGPALILLAGLAAAWRFYRGRRTEPAPAPLNPDEERRLKALMEEDRTT
jgi:cytochrome c-type biogenesis protein CcmH